MITFEDRAEEMGLEKLEDGSFHYEDQYSAVRYKPLYTLPPDPEQETEPDETFGYNTGLLGIFTKPVNVPDAQWSYVSYISRVYKFVGNDAIMSALRNSINSVGMPVLQENSYQSWKLSGFRGEIVLSSPVNAPTFGDILPVMVVLNSYDGTQAQMVTFGLCMDYQGYNHMFAFKLGRMRQIHVAGASTEMSSSVQDYVRVFSESMIELIGNSFNTRLNEEQLFGTLDVIEKIGKKARDEISKTINDMTNEGELPSAWHVFLAITRYSSLEANLNTKRLMENAAERVLVIPERMLNLLEELQK
jgi:hypothetical protein